MKMIFSENIELIEAFYDLKFYKKLSKNPNVIKRVIKAIYRDPDMMDTTLMRKAKEYNDYFKEREMDLCFSPDGICGWKILFEVYSDNGDNSWIEKYKAIRG